MTARLRRLLPLAAFAAAVLAAPSPVVRAEGAAGLAERLQGGLGGGLEVAALPGLGLRWRVEAGAGGGWMQSPL